MYEVLVTDIDLPLDYMTYRTDIFELAGYETILNTK